MSSKQIEGLLTTRLLCSIFSCILDYDNDSSDNDHDDYSSIFFTRRLFITIPRDITTVIMTHKMWIPEFLAVYSETEDAVASAGTLHSASFSITSVSYPAIYVREDWGKVEARGFHGKGQSLPKSPCAL